MPDIKSDFRPDVIITDKKPTKVAIVGFAPNWDKAPFGNDDFEIWGLNELYKYFSTKKEAVADRWFEIHSRESPTKNIPEHMEWLKQCPIPIYMHDHYDDIPSSVKYPLDEVLEFVYQKGMRLDVAIDGGFRREKNRYGTNSITWMFLLAWMEGFKEIHIYGVDLACNEEYLYQRPNLEYYIGGAQVDGVTVVMPESCDLLKAALLYGFESDNKFRIKMKERNVELSGRIKVLAKELEKIEQQKKGITQAEMNLKGQIIALEGCTKENKHWLANWVV